MKYSFVVPCYRSEKTIMVVCSQISDEMKSLNEDSYEIILVNDCSPDGTWTVIKSLAENDKRIKAVNLTKNFGQHSALMAGYRQCVGDFIVSLDDDGQIPLGELNLLLEKLPEHDVVYAFYDKIKQNLFRRCGHFFTQKMAEVMLNMHKGLKGSSFFVMKKFIAEEIIRYENPYPYIPGLVIWSTTKIACVKVYHKNRLEGHSGYSLKKLFSLWMNGFTAFSVKPLRVATMMGAVVAFIGFLSAVYMAVKKLLNPTMPVGYSSMMCVLLFISGMIMLMLGLIGEYVGRIYICLNKLPQYVVRNTINCEE